MCPITATIAHDTHSVAAPLDASHTGFALLNYRGRARQRASRRRVQRRVGLPPVPADLGTESRDIDDRTAGSVPTQAVVKCKGFCQPIGGRESCGPPLSRCCRWDARSAVNLPCWTRCPPFRALLGGPETWLREKRTVLTGLASSLGRCMAAGDKEVGLTEHRRRFSPPEPSAPDVIGKQRAHSVYSPKGCAEALSACRTASNGVPAPANRCEMVARISNSRRRDPGSWRYLQTFPRERRGQPLGRGRLGGSDRRSTGVP